MAHKRLKRPRDPIQLGKLIVDIATGQVEDRPNSRSGDDCYMIQTSLHCPSDQPASLSGANNRLNWSFSIVLN